MFIRFAVSTGNANKSGNRRDDQRSVSLFCVRAVGNNIVSIEKSPQSPQFGRLDASTKDLGIGETLNLLGRNLSPVIDPWNDAVKSQKCSPGSQFWDLSAPLGPFWPMGSVDGITHP